ncbi:hypothetical protein HMI56_005423 [Coelomomyces lativittatus]|nr:hypothetical protein HMI56_005423 [Coelomomyces lativittatus]
MASTPPLFLDPNKPIAQSLAIFASSSSSTTPNSFRVLHHFSYELSKLSVDELTKLCKSVKICSSGRKLLKIQTYVFWLCQLPTTGLILKELQTFNSQIIKEGHRLGQDEIQILARYLHELQIPQITKRKVGRPLKRPLFMTTSTTPMSLSHASPTKKLAFSSRITGMMTIPSISTTTTTTTTTTTSPTFSTSTAPTKSTKSSTKNSPLTPLDTFIRNPCPSIFHSPIVWKGAVLPWELIQYQLEPFYSWHSSLAGRQLSLGDTNLHLLKFELSEKDVRLLS